MGDVGVSVRDGVRRVNAAPVVLAGVWLLTVAVALPLGLVVRQMIAQHLGDSLAADSAASGVNAEWMQEFAAQASGVGVTFNPTIIGFGAVLGNVSDFLDDATQPIVIAGVAVVYVLLWIFFAGGILDRYARDRAIGTHGFFAACGVFFFRFLRLAIFQSIVYGFLFRVMHPWLFDRLYPRMIHDVTVERTAFFARVTLYVVFGALVAGSNLIFDYAKVRAVVEDRRSMVGAIAGALGFVQRNSAAAIAVYAVDVALFLVVLGLYALMAPGVPAAGLTMWLAFAIGQIYIVARLWVKLLFWASETALFQSRLAHAGYVARPEPGWPDSPAADAIA